MKRGYYLVYLLAAAPQFSMEVCPAGQLDKNSLVSIIENKINADSPVLDGYSKKVTIHFMSPAAVCTDKNAGLEMKKHPQYKFWMLVAKSPDKETRFPFTAEISYQNAGDHKKYQYGFDKIQTTFQDAGIKKGDILIMEFQQGFIRSQSQVISLADSPQNGLLKVTSLDQKRKYLAEIIQPGKVVYKKLL